MSQKHIATGCILSLFLGIFSVAAAEQRFGKKPPIEGFEQIIPRGRIASIDNPRFVTAKQASISDKAWVLGVKVNGQAYAYDLNLLNSHEIVNHTAGDKPIAAVW